MSHNYSTALSHIILAITGLYCIKNHGINNKNFNISQATYLLIVNHSVIGMWRWGNPGHGNGAERFYNFTGFLQSLVILPGFTIELCSKHRFQIGLAYLNLVAILLVLSLYFSKHNVGKLVFLLNLANCLLAGFVAYTSKSYWGLVATISFVLAFFIIKERLQDIEMPIQDLFNYGLSFFLYFAMRALQE